MVSTMHIVPAFCRRALADVSGAQALQQGIIALLLVIKRLCIVTSRMRVSCAWQTLAHWPARSTLFIDDIDALA
jgi:hypothetical protein